MEEPVRLLGGEMSRIEQEAWNLGASAAGEKVMPFL
jgi:hypothetical protein